MKRTNERGEAGPGTSAGVPPGEKVMMMMMMLMMVNDDDGVPLVLPSNAQDPEFRSLKLKGTYETIRFSCE